MSLLLQSYGWGLLFFVVFYLTGKVLLRAGENTGTARGLLIFGRVAIGAMLWTIVGAMVWTQGNTSMWLLLILGLFPLIHYKPWKGSTGSFFTFERQNVTLFAWSLGLLALLLGIQGFVFMRPDSLLIPHVDWQFYATLADLLPEYGIENTRLAFMEYLPQEEPTTMLYHFLDLWTISLFTKVSGLTSIQAYIYLYIPVFGFTILWGFLGLFEYLAQRKIWWLPLLFPVVYYAGLMPFVPESLSRTLFTLPKTLPGYLALVPLVVFIVQRRWVAVAAIACCLALANIVYAPAAFTTVFLLGLHQIWKGDGWQKSKALVLLPIATIALLGLFYFVLHSPEVNTFQTGGDGGSSRSLGQWLFGIAWVAFLSTRLVYVPLLFLPLTALLLLNAKSLIRLAKQEYGPLFLFLSVLFLCTFFLAALVSSLHSEFVQLARLLVNPFMAISTIAGLAILFRSSGQTLSWRWYVPTGLFLGASAYVLVASYLLTDRPPMGRSYYVSTDFMTELSEKLEGHTLGGFIWTNNPNAEGEGLREATLKYGGYLKHLDTDREVLPMQLPDSAYMRSHKAQFDPYLQFQLANPGESQPEWAFMRHFGASFVMVAANVELPRYLQDLAIDRVVDPMSQHVVYIFNLDAYSSSNSNTDVPNIIP